jgi:hypothetical protein
MLNSIEKQIIIRISKARRGTLFFNDSFINYGTAEAVRQALSRLVKAGELERVSAGIYVRPQTNSVVGKIIPGMEEVAKAIARRDRARIVPTGDYALNRLGLSTQIPMNVVYLTDGAARKVKIGNRSITFRKTTPKNLAAIGEISGLVIQALRTLGKDNVSENDIKKIREFLLREEPLRLQHDIRLAPAWIREIMKAVLKELSNG